MSELPALYEIADSYRQLLDMDLPAEQVADTLALVQEDFEKKAQHIGFVVESMDVTEKALSAHLDDVKKRLEAVKNRKQALKDYLQTNMEATGISKIECQYFKISLQASPASVVVDDESLIPDDYFITTRALQKATVKQALKDGYDIPGCHLEAGTHVRIR